MLRGKKVVVTGASRGIGAAIACACAREGATVGINCRQTSAAAETVVADIVAEGGSAYLVPFDVRDPDAVQAGLQGFVDREGSIDGLVNNAAVAAPGLLLTLTDASLRDVVDTNLLGPLYCARAVLQPMLKRRGGVILNVGSVSAERPWRGQSVYAATKGALESLTCALAVEYGPKGIRVHCLRPGPIETVMLAPALALGGEQILSRLPLRRVGQPAEVAEFAVFLLSNRASYVTGATHTVDGGFLEG